MSNKSTHYAAIVVGGGHAGIEAAHAVAMLGQKVLLLTMSIESIGQMSCNPAIGGVGKGHLVKEIDALGGLMGRMADQTGIQFRKLNTKKGAAVQATRCQTDMLAYKTDVRKVLEKIPNLEISQREVKSLIWGKDKVKGVITDIEEELYSHTIIITTGTFLNGLIHIGKQKFKAGRAWESPSVGLSLDLQRHGFQTGRLKTGTTPRLNKNTINFSLLEEQVGDNPAPQFSFFGDYKKMQQVSCFITYTNEKSHQIIIDNLSKSAMYGGDINSVGPRYCPSIEDKVIRFADKSRHQIFLEPTSLSSLEYYPNGMSTSMPFEVQVDFMRSIKGLDKVEIVKPGYAIEYDYVLPHQLKNTLETKLYSNLYLAGQINGTTGYEEAAAQGIIAGINAGLHVKQQDPLVLKRHEAYIGVLIDDLITKGTEEPYRMFTSRAEYRLLLREDNADQRLSPKGFYVGLLGKEKYDIFLKKQERIAKLQSFLGTNYIKFANTSLLQENIDNSDVSKKLNPVGTHKMRKILLSDFLKSPQNNFQGLNNFLDPEQKESLNFYSENEKFILENDLKYSGYVKRQATQIKNYTRLDGIIIPESINYCNIQGLSNEVKEKLSHFRPINLGQAYKISGITPAAITILSAFIRNSKRLAS